MNSPLIIEQRGLQSAAKEFGWTSVTFFFWLVYIYLWLPLLTLFVWYVSLKLFNVHMIELKGYTAFLKLLKYYLIVIACIGITVIGWAKIEYYRFSKKTARKKPRTITIEDVASYYKVSAVTLGSLRHERIVNVHFLENGSISHFSKPSDLAQDVAQVA